jgi:type IV fimbrial biogenesis protein FimT
MSGFGLIEIMVVLSISSILAGALAPSFISFFTSLQIKTATDSLFNDLMLAKSEAIKRNSRVAICKSTDVHSCTSSGGWEHGWIIFHDVNNSGTREPTEEIVKSFVIAKPSATIAGNGNINSYVSFSGLGSTKLVSGAFQAGTFTVCSLESRNLDGKKVVINNTGKVRVAKVPVSLCP